MGPRVDPVASDETLPARADVVDHRRRHHRHQRGAVPGAEGRLGGAVREGPHRRRAVEPQLGLVPQDGARPARDPAGDREPAPVGADERDGRGRDRVPHLRDHVSRRDRGRSRAARSLARARARIPARHAGDRRAPRCRRGCPASPRTGPARSTPPSDGKGEPQLAAPAIAEAARRLGAGDPHELRGARHRDRGRAGRRRSSPKRAASPASRWCWPAGHGRGCSAAISGSSCRSSRCWAR